VSERQRTHRRIYFDELASEVHDLGNEVRALRNEFRTIGTELAASRRFTIALIEIGELNAEQVAEAAKSAVTV